MSDPVEDQWIRKWAEEKIRADRLFKSQYALLRALERIITRFDEQEAIGINTDEYEAACAAIAQAKRGAGVP